MRSSSTREFYAPCVDWATHYHLDIEQGDSPCLFDLMELGEKLGAWMWGGLNACAKLVPGAIAHRERKKKQT